MNQLTSSFAHLNGPTVIWWVCVALAAFIVIWMCVFVARVASAFGRGIFIVLALMLGIGMYLGPWAFSIVHAIGIR